MMKKLFTLVFAALMLLSLDGFSQGFTVKGSIDGLETGKVTLQKRGGEKFATGLDNGSFEMKGKIIEAGLFSLTVEGVRGRVSIFLDNTTYNVKAAKKNNGTADVLEVIEVKAGKVQDVYNAFNDLSAELSKKLEVDNADYIAAYNAKDEAKMTKLRPKLDEDLEKMDAAKMAFIKKQNNSIVGAYLLTTVARTVEDPNELEGLINNLSSEFSGTSYVKSLKDGLKITRKTAVGVMAPDFTQNDQDGNPISLSDFRGQVVLVDFWASWCGPCRKENPNVVEAFKKFNNKGFTVLGVSFDRPGAKDKWLQAVEDDGLTWPQVSDLKFWDNAAGKIYGIRSIPSNVLVGKDGKILAKNLRGEALHVELKKLLK